MKRHLSWALVVVGLFGAGWFWVFGTVKMSGKDAFKIVR
jgi:hypothetical protein